jgi:hypothetical protein
MNAYQLEKILEQCSRNPAAQHPQIAYDSTRKVCEVTVEKFEHEHKVYSSHRLEKGVGPDILKLAPGLAKKAYFAHQVQIVREGASDNFLLEGLWGYKPWRAETDVNTAARDPFADVWVRCRLTKPILLIAGLEQESLFPPYTRFKAMAVD